jgi:23S rRNA (uracil1939-C5)-methyltransferase
VLGMQVEVTIEKLGAQGDGVAVTDGGPVFVPFALPGERVRVKAAGERGTLLKVLEPSADRAAPECSHFGKCGGCAVQHLERKAYLAWKRDQAAAALRSRGIEAEVEEVRPVPPGSRRRTAFTLKREGKRVKICHHGRKSHDLVEIEQCALLEPRLGALVSRLPGVLAPAVGARGAVELWLLACENGIDVTLKGAANAGPDFLANLASEAPSLGVIRVTINGDMALSLASPQVRFAGALATPPPGAFLQAVAAAEAELAGLAVAGVGEAGTVVDLFAGMGAFTFPLARRSRVTAIESDRRSLGALAAASRSAVGFKPITRWARDLFRDPFSARELKSFDAAVLDPPRAGASAQAAELAKSTVPRVVMASCNPSAFARDARTLIDGGYRLDRVTPVDQFLYSPHLELVARFIRT